MTRFTLAVAFLVLGQSGFTHGQEDGNLKIKIESTAGKTVEAGFAGVTQEGFSYLQAASKTSIALDQLKQVEFLSNKRIDSNPQFQVYLKDKTRIGCDSLLLSGQSATLLRGSDQVSLSSKSLSHIEVGDLSKEQIAYVKKSLVSESSGDALFVRQPNGALTKIDGVVAGITDEAVSFELGDQQVPVKFEKLAAITLFSAAKNGPAPAKGTATTVFGDQYYFSSLSLAPGGNSDGQRMALDLACGDLVEIEVENLKLLSFALGSTQYLAEIEPLRSSSERLFDFPVPELNDGKLFGFRSLPRKRIPGSSQGPCLISVGSGEVTFEIPKGFQRLVGSAQLAPRGNKKTACKIEIYLESKLLWSSRLTAPFQPASFDVEVAEDQRLKLVASSEGQLPTGNIVEWIEPVLMKQ